MTARELRRKYLEFFESKGHTVHPSGSLVPIDVTGRLDESLLFNGAGMVQFKPYFRGVVQPPNKRLATAQKCVRTGDIDEVGDLTHLTFFEMMGNFSFGDYFKRDAIAFSWEFITSPRWLALDPHRLAITVFLEDDESFNHWAEHFEAAGIAPETRIFRRDEDENYWPAGAFSKGPPGPCGPNSEMYYWVSSDPVPGTKPGDYASADYERDEKAGQWLEFWNDVFIQYEWQGELNNPERPVEGYKKTGMPPLPFQSIDTGMGLERAATVLGGMTSVYEIDLFEPIFRRIDRLSVNPIAPDDDLKNRARRIVADHIRTACFCIADGILPGNSGRGYVLRRLIRRAVLKGLRTLGFEKPFFHLVFEGVLEAMGDHYTQLADRKETIVETLKSEEELFRRTITAGTALLQEQLMTLKSGDTLTGSIAFRLYDTFGFPLEVTKELCEEVGIHVDEDGYEVALKEAQDRSRGASDMDTVYGGVDVQILLGNQDGTATPTVFAGYSQTESEATMMAIMPTGDGHVGIALDVTPFYAESGGQVSDTGVIRGEGFEFEVLDLVKQDGVYVHLCKPQFELTEQNQEALNKRFLTEVVVAQVDAKRRSNITRNHTATHLLHAALRQVLGRHVTQAGSLVAPDHLRFDFTHGKALSDAERSEIENLVNEQALKATPVITYVDLPIAEAKARGAMALFGEKYGEFVRMVEIPGFSVELCGGVHVGQTSEVGLFRITHEASAASGVRRIEALTGLGAYQWVTQQVQTLNASAELVKSNPKDLPSAIERTLESLREEKRRREKAEMAMARGTQNESTDIETLPNGIQLWKRRFDDLDQKIVASAVDDAVAQSPNVVAFAALVAEGKITFIGKAGREALAKGAHVGNVIREMAKLAGGGGGGRADFATAGGKDLTKVDTALKAVDQLLST